MCSNITAQSLFSVFKCLVPILDEAQLKKKKNCPKYSLYRFPCLEKHNVETESEIILNKHMSSYMILLLSLMLLIYVVVPSPFM